MTRRIRRPGFAGLCRAWPARIAGLLLLALWMTLPARAANILFVVSADPANPGDAAIAARLAFALGHSVTYYAAADSSYIARARLRDAATTNPYDLVIVSESISSASVGDAFRNLGKPVIVMESALFDDMAMTGAAAGDLGQTTLQTQIEVLPSAHPLAAGLSGPVTVYSSNLSVGWGRTLGSGAIRVATAMNAPTNCAIFAYDAGAPMAGLNAPARRVGFFLFGFATQAVEVPYAMDAYTLLDAAVSWALEPASLQGPTVTITYPGSGMAFAANANISIQAQAQDAGGSVASVDFYAQSAATNRWLGQAVSAPFSFAWNQAPEGNYILMAVATDNDGLTMNSPSVEITVGAPPKPALFIVNNLVLGSGDAAVSNILHAMGIEVITKLASASSSADAEDKLLVLVSGTVSSGDVLAKFHDAAVPVITWEPFILDDMGMCGLEANVQYGTTNAQTQVVIANAGHPLAAGLAAGPHAVVAAPETFMWGDVSANPSAIAIAHLVDDPAKSVIFGYETGVQLSDGTSALARRVAVFMLDMAAASFTPEGRHLFEAAVNWAINRTSPTVRITSPAPDAAFPAGANIAIQCQAEDANGSVTNVQFYATSLKGTIWVGEDSATPFEIVWPSVAEGRYSLAAVARDNDGLQTGSAPVNIVVGTPPEPLWILFVVNAATPNVPDTAVRDHLASLGNTVTTRAATSASGIPALRDHATTNDYDLIIVSESISSGNVGNAFRDLAKPVIANESFIFDDMALTGTVTTNDFGIFTYIGLQTNITIIDAAHPLAAGLSGDVPVYVTPTSGCYGRTVGAGAILVATMVDHPEHYTLFAYDAGAQMVGMAAPARRVGMFVFSAGTVVPYTPNVYALLEAAVNWAVGREPIPAPALEIGLAGGSIRISWPESAAGFQLESTGSLPNDGPWTTVGELPVAQDGRNVVTLPLGASNAFFRLRK
ncbi:MAG TPA: Ig-like domain-containing protein [Candidatus Paceibacterota bacterium]|nr:Ig-like domain-containing protein [Verrucomicrobiota bacterium]HRZ45446.1 Ig-like domain-containing protein [Candidatus Paceibacterota bacterium]